MGGVKVWVLDMEPERGGREHKWPGDSQPNPLYMKMGWCGLAKINAVATHSYALTVPFPYSLVTGEALLLVYRFRGCGDHAASAKNSLIGYRSGHLMTGSRVCYKMSLQTRHSFLVILHQSSQNQA
jgi:hypothetical protein